VVEGELLDKAAKIKTKSLIIYSTSSHKERRVKEKLK
jgi:hypothetical protein